MKKRLLNYILFIGKIFFCTYIVYVLISQQPVLEAKTKQKEQLTQKLEEAKMIEGELRTNLALADTQEFIEQMAREKLGLLKPGEKVFVDIRR